LRLNRNKIAKFAVNLQFKQWHIIKALYSGFSVIDEQHSLTT